MFLLVLGLLRGNEDGWTSGGIVATLAGALVLLAAIGLIQLRSPRPMLPLRLLRDRAFAGAQVAVMGISASFFALFLYLTLYLQGGVLGYSPLQAGLRFLPITALMLVVGRRVFPWILWQVTRTGSRELFTLCVVAAAVSIAFASAALFGVSFALGAFFAGMVMRESEFSHRAAQESLPLRDAFAVLFFVSVGMLFNPSVLIERPLQVLAVVGVIVLGKSIAACALVLVFRYPLGTALTVSASLAQIGEFSFILAGLGVSLGLLPVEGQSLVLAGALISIATNPLWFSLIAPMQKWLHAQSSFARGLESRDDPLAELPMTTEAKYLSRQVVLVGYGRVGRRIAAELEAHDIPYVVAEQNRELVEKLREAGIAAVWGDAADPAVLIQAHVARARVLVVATPDTMNVRQMIETARTLNPTIQTVIRSHNEQEAQLLTQESAVTVFLGEHELAQAMARDVVQRAVSMAMPASVA